MFKTSLLSAISALALLFATPAWAQSVNNNDDNERFGAAISTVDLDQDGDWDVDSNLLSDEYDARMDFGSSTFRDQTVNQNNFNTGALSQQQGALVITVGVGQVQ
jgi:hypothetical protein